MAMPLALAMLIENLMAGMRENGADVDALWFARREDVHVSADGGTEPALSA
ncbi:hypothetical protein ACH35V_27160 [Actinomadura sp. 1N219]|uniref:hypothetical protein n=1 Tax=Actinomadura sp. 1N219 TaxID=3375152 RepID=UPI0037B9FDD4